MSLWYLWIAGALLAVPPSAFVVLLVPSPLPSVLPLAIHLPPSSPTAIFSPEVNLVFIVLVSRRTSSSEANGYRDVLITRLPIAGLSFPLIIPILTTRTSRTGILFCLDPLPPPSLPPVAHLNSRLVHDKLWNPIHSGSVNSHHIIEN